MRTLLLAIAPLLTLGCHPQGEPEIIAHRAAAGYWPENSRLAMERSVQADFDGIEVDLALTADRVPVLSHDPWVPHVCTYQNGEEITSRDLLAELTLDELRERYECGGHPDPAFPNAELRSEEMYTLDAMIKELRYGDPDVVVYLDIKYELGFTELPEIFAEEILGRWFEADLPNPTWVFADNTAAIGAFETYARANGHSLRTALTWPEFPPDASSTAIGLSSELQQGMGLGGPLADVRDAGADGVAVYWELASRQLTRDARDDGVDLFLWTLNGPELESHLDWDVTGVITDYPGDVR